MVRLLSRKQKILGSNPSWACIAHVSVLGPLLFVVFINDIDDGILSKISKFTDETKLCRAVGDDQEADVLREDLRRMFRWSQDWKMLFNLEKCSVMHMGKRNQE